MRKRMAQPQEHRHGVALPPFARECPCIPLRLDCAPRCCAQPSEYAGRLLEYDIVGSRPRPWFCGGPQGDRRVEDHKMEAPKPVSLGAVTPWNSRYVYVDIYRPIQAVEPVARQQSQAEKCFCFPYGDVHWEARVHFALWAKDKQNNLIRHSEHYRVMFRRNVDARRFRSRSSSTCFSSTIGAQGRAPLPCPRRGPWTTTPLPHGVQPLEWCDPTQCSRISQTATKSWSAGPEKPSRIGRNDEDDC
jgi:hypothetical protein